MKMNNVFLVSALVCSLMVQSLLFSVKAAAVVPAGVEETKDVAVMAPEQEGPSAKITLLRDQVDQANKLGQTTLMHAAMHGDLEIVKLLVGSGADVNKTNSKTGETALDYARNNHDILKYLLVKAHEAAEATATDTSAATTDA
jgi:hypothetical protein